MSNKSLIIEERAAIIGNFMVGRLLPFRKKRMVGPFIFVDHMGPAHMSANENMDIGPHPHIGLSTLTYLLEGNMRHRDSTGSDVEIKPGAVNWMSAGKGVVHSERTPQALRGKEKTMHGLQIWVAQPKEVENEAPFFSHTEAQDLPTWQDDKVNYKLVAGKAFGKSSPVPVHSELFLLEITSKEEAEVCIGKELYGEVGIYILEGNIEAEGNIYEAKQLLVNTANELCSISLKANAHIFIFGGIPFEEERFIFWNFVSSSKETLEKAKEDWMNKRFAEIEGEDDLIPIPGMEF